MPKHHHQKPASEPVAPERFQVVTNGVEPLVVGTADAMRMAGHKKTKLFALVKAGEYESFLDGRNRMITTASIRARIERKLQEAKANPATT